MMQHLSIPQYLLESSFCLVIFYSFYWLFLKNETFFQFNRFYLIGSALLALLIPIINVDFTSAGQFSGAQEIYPFINKMNAFQIGIQQTITQESNALNISLGSVINWIYLAGFFVMSLKLFHGIFKLFGIINRSPKLKDKDHTLLISEDVPAASFFSYIFWEDKHDKEDLTQRTIMDHEMVHVRQWHSLDVIAMELMVVIKWFNPLIYLFKNSLRKTHEFIADQYVTDKLGDKVSYANMLLATSNSGQHPPITNHFYGHVRERIAMLGTKKSSWFKKVKFLAILPITVALFSLFSFDLSDKLPKPIMTTLQNLESSMLAVGETNIISLNIDPEKEKNKFNLNWANIMNISMTQKNETQDFIFTYSADNLDLLLSGLPTIQQNGKSLKLFVDSLELIRNNHKMEVDLASLKDDRNRKIFIDSLGALDQIMLKIRSYSDTDSLNVRLHLNIENVVRRYYQRGLDEQKEYLKWGQKIIEFYKGWYQNDLRINLDHSVTKEELFSMLDSKIEFSPDGILYKDLPEQLMISFKVNRSSNTRLARIEAEQLTKFREEKKIPESTVMFTSHYHGKSYSIEESSLMYRFEDFYKEKEVFKDWLSTIKNGDNIKINIHDNQKVYNSFEFNLRYRDADEAISAPFPIDMPHTNDTYTSFQIALTNGGEAFVRLDPNDPNNQKIMDAYKNSESYVVVKIPGFKTKLRIRQPSLPTGTLTKNEIIDNELGQLNPLMLNEYYSEDDQLVRMDWGRMVSMPNIGNYSIKEFKRSSKEDLTLFVGTKDLKMDRFDLLIIPENGKIKRIRTDKVNTQFIREILDQVEVNTSIYVDNIVVDVEGVQMYYPYNFVFTLE